MLMKLKENNAQELFRRCLQINQELENDRHHGDGNEVDWNVNDGVSETLDEGAIQCLLPSGDEARLGSEKRGREFRQRT